MQQQDSKEVTIDGFRYKITHNNPEIAWDIGIELSKLIGEPVAGMALAGESGAVSALSIAVGAFLGKLDSKASWGMMKRILATVEVQGEEGGDNKKIMLDENGIKIHFRGKTGSLLKVASEAVTFTHADFFDAIGDGIAKMMKKLPGNQEE